MSQELDYFAGVADELFAAFDKKGDFRRVWASVPVLARDMYEYQPHFEQLLTTKFVRTIAEKVFPDHVMLDRNPRENALNILMELNRVRSEPMPTGFTNQRILERLNAGMVGYCSMLELEMLEIQIKEGEISAEEYEIECKFWNDMVCASVAAALIELP